MRTFVVLHGSPPPILRQIYKYGKESRHISTVICRQWVQIESNCLIKALLCSEDERKSLVKNFPAAAGQSGSRCSLRESKTPFRKSSSADGDGVDAAVFKVCRAALFSASRVAADECGGRDATSPIALQRRCDSCSSFSRSGHWFLSNNLHIHLLLLDSYRQLYVNKSIHHSTPYIPSPHSSSSSTSISLDSQQSQLSNIDYFLKSNGVRTY